MYLEQLGWDSHFDKNRNDAGLEECIPARVAEETKEIYKVFSQQGTFLAEIAGRIRFHARGRSDFPAVGDWVLITPTENRATIHSILPRKTIIARKSAGKDFNEQILASNVDTVFIVTSLNQDLNLRRLERYMAIVWESGCQPVVILNKADLCAETAVFEWNVKNIAPQVPVHVMSGLTGAGADQLPQYLTFGKTGIFLGSSGVGKSTILNRLAGKTLQHVHPIREWDDRGRHTTTSRQMILLRSGGIVIDTPGMRKMGMWDSEAGLSKTFHEIEELSPQCKFRDCRHDAEPGCAVLAALEHGILERDRLENYRKLRAELRYNELKTDARARQQAKAGMKRINRAIKKFYKDRGL